DNQLVPRVVRGLEPAQRIVARDLAVLAEDVQRRRETLEHRALDLAMAGEHDEPLARGEEVVDPGERSMELAAGGEQLERVEPDEALGAERGGNPRVELTEIEGLTAKPRDDVLFGEAIFRLIVELDRHDGARLRRQLGQDVGLEASRETACAKVPVKAVVGVWALEALTKLRARAKIAEPTQYPQL